MSKSALQNIEGLEPVDPQKLEQFLGAMDKVIPDIVEAVEDRRLLAMESRDRQLRIDYK
jgi:hypothetical protein